MRLSQLDAFFVAYQQEKGVQMQVCAELELAGEVTSDRLRRMCCDLVARWPQLGQRLRIGWFGLHWDGPSDAGALLTENAGAADVDVTRWRNGHIDPFAEPPFQILCTRRADGVTLTFRAHHAVCDGESLRWIIGSALRGLAGERATPRDVSAPRPRTRRRRRGWLRRVRQLRAHAREVRSLRVGRMAVNAVTPGDTDTVVTTLGSDAARRLAEGAAGAGVPSAFWCAAAWLRAIHAWNVARGSGDRAWLSLEVPVSFRGSDACLLLGNRISPLFVGARADLPLAEVAVGLREQFVRRVRERRHLAMPSLTAAGRFLPWALFRRIAPRTDATGFATSHFTCFAPPGDAFAEVARNGIELRAVRLHPPVCLHMGTALAVLIEPARVVASMAYRLSALSPAEVETLSGLLQREMIP